MEYREYRQISYLAAENMARVQQLYNFYAPVLEKGFFRDLGAQLILAGE